MERKKLYYYACMILLLLPYQLKVKDERNLICMCEIRKQKKPASVAGKQVKLF